MNQYYTIHIAHLFLSLVFMNGCVPLKEKWFSFGFT